MLSKAMEEDPDLRPVLEERFQKVQIIRSALFRDLV